MPIRVDPERVCEICSGPITPKNKTGICTASTQCRSALQKKWNGGQRPGVVSGKPENSPWLLPVVYEIDEDGNTIFVNDQGEPTPEECGGHPIEIIDDVAINVAVEGTRHVGLTTTERRIVVQRMIQGAWGANEIARHCGTILHRLKPIFADLGYEVVPPRRPNGKRIAAAAEIRRIKRLGEVDG